MPITSPFLPPHPSFILFRYLNEHNLHFKFEWQPPGTCGRIVQIVRSRWQWLKALALAVPGGSDMCLNKLGLITPSRGWLALSVTQHPINKRLLENSSFSSQLLYCWALISLWLMRMCFPSSGDPSCFSKPYPALPCSVISLEDSGWCHFMNTPWPMEWKLSTGKQKYCNLWTTVRHSLLLLSTL